MVTHFKTGQINDCQKMLIAESGECYLPAFNTIRFGEPVCQALFGIVFTRTPIKMKGYVIVQKKLYTIYFALWNKDVGYDPLYYSQHVKDFEYAVEATPLQIH